MNYNSKSQKSSFDRQQQKKHHQSNQRKRIVVLDHEKCKPNSEAFRYLKRQMGQCRRDCIQLVARNPQQQQQPDAFGDKQQRFVISETACPVCVTRAKLCPGGAVKLVNLPSHLNVTTHWYGPNAFQLHGLPMPRPGNVLGVLGGNGQGKSTALQILSGNLKPNLGITKQHNAPTWEDIVKFYRGSDLQNYFQKMLEGKLRCVTQLGPAAFSLARYRGKTVRQVLKEGDSTTFFGGKFQQEVIRKLQLDHLLNRPVQALSGGERQRLSVCMCATADADVYLFDEPTSFLDVKQRLLVAEVIRSLVDNNTEISSKYVIVVEHDLTVLDYVCDHVCPLYGEPGAYGVVAKRCTTANGINQFIDGYLKAENVRFRDQALSFHTASSQEDTPFNSDGPLEEYTYPSMCKTYKAAETTQTPFTLSVEAGSIKEGEIVGMLAQNGCGKTTLTEMIFDHFTNKANTKENSEDSRTMLGISYKRQHVPRRLRTFRGSVEEFLNEYMPWGQANELFSIMVKRPLKMDQIKDLAVQSLSTGELQRLMICVCLGTPASVYLLDEPSAFLDCEMRLVVAKVIKDWIVKNPNKSAYIVEHDLIMASTLFDRVIVFEGQPGVSCLAKSPVAPAQGLNMFLGSVQVTLCQSATSNRPRINKRGSRRDREQRKSGEYFTVETKEAPEGCTTSD